MLIAAFAAVSAAVCARRRGFSGTTEPRPPRLPRDRVAADIGNGYDRIIEGGLNMGGTRSIFFFFARRETAFLAVQLSAFVLCPSLLIISSYYNGLFRTFAVLALVLVLCPRTGRPFLWRHRDSIRVQPTLDIHCGFKAQIASNNQCLSMYSRRVAHHLTKIFDTDRGSMPVSVRILEAVVRRCRKYR
jgi:hypothetical protein